MGKGLVRDGLVWGALLWLFGYLLGIVFFFVVPKDFLGWAIMPFGLTVTLWVVIKKIHSTSLTHYAAVGVIWAALAVVLDYVLLVKLFHPADYYKPDIFLYYGLNLLLPLGIGWWKLKREG